MEQHFLTMWQSYSLMLDLENCGRYGQKEQLDEQSECRGWTLQIVAKRYGTVLELLVGDVLHYHFRLA